MRVFVFVLLILLHCYHGFIHFLHWVKPLDYVWVCVSEWLQPDRLSSAHTGSRKTYAITNAHACKFTFIWIIVFFFRIAVLCLSVTYKRWYAQMWSHLICRCRTSCSFCRPPSSSSSPGSGHSTVHGWLMIIHWVYAGRVSFHDDCITIALRLCHCDDVCNAQNFSQWQTNYWIKLHCTMCMHGLMCACSSYLGLIVIVIAHCSLGLCICWAAGDELNVQSIRNQ